MNPRNVARNNQRMALPKKKSTGPRAEASIAARSAGGKSTVRAAVVVGVGAVASAIISWAQVSRSDCWMTAAQERLAPAPEQALVQLELGLVPERSEQEPVPEARLALEPGQARPVRAPSSQERAARRVPGRALAEPPGWVPVQQ